MIIINEVKKQEAYPSLKNLGSKTVDFKTFLAGIKRDFKWRIELFSFKQGKKVLICAGGRSDVRITADEIAIGTSAGADGIYTVKFRTIALSAIEEIRDTIITYYLLPLAQNRQLAYLLEVR